MEAGRSVSRYPVPDNRTKLATCGLALDREASGYGPVLADGYGWLSCRIVAHLDLAGDHGLTVGQVETAAFDDTTFDADIQPVVDLHPVMQVTGNRFTTATHSHQLPYFD